MRVLYLFVALSSFSFSQNGEKNFIDQPFIEVRGTVETEIIPNEIYLNIILKENDNKGKLSVETQENKMISVLESLNIDLNKNFSIQDFDGSYQRKFLADNKVIKTKHYELIVNDGKMLGKVYEALDTLNISDVSIKNVSHSDIENIRRETKLKALKVAKEKAENYAEAIDQNIGKALFIQENDYNDLGNLLVGNANGLNHRGYSKYENDKKQNLNFKSIKVSATVLAKFILN